MESSDLALPSPRAPRYFCLDLWRGVACLMVVAMHAAMEANHDAALAEQSGFERMILNVIGRLGVGVPMFFVISGYCIAATADAARRRDGGARNYMIRRFRRIFPPYWAAMFLTVLLGAWMLPAFPADMVPGPASLNTTQWIGNATLTEGWRYHLTGPSSPRLMMLGPAWTLCYEEQFYAVMGLLVLLTPQRLFAAAVVVTVLSALVMAIGYRSEWVAVDNFFFDGRWLLFASGVLVYYTVNYASSRRACIGVLIAFLIASLAVRYGFQRHGATWEQKDRVFELITGAAFALLLLALHRWDRAMADMKFLRPLFFCGTMCYSLYLVHYPVTLLISHAMRQHGWVSLWGTLLGVVPIATAAAIALGAAFHWTVERRFLNPPSYRPASPHADDAGSPAGASLPVR